MPCKHYKDALIEAAAGGVELQGDVRAHLTGCAECRAAFEQERALYATIDSGLHVTANAEVPVSLLPRVRARINAEAVPGRGWAANWLVLATATAIVAGILVARVVWRPVVGENPSFNSAGRRPSAPTLRSSHEDAQNSEHTAKNIPPLAQQTVAALSLRKAEVASARHASPEVLVPKDQEALLAVCGAVARAQARSACRSRFGRDNSCTFGSCANPNHRA